MPRLLLDVVSWQWHGKALPIWIAWAFDAAKSTAGLALAAAALYLIIRKEGRRRDPLDASVPYALKAPLLAGAAGVLLCLKTAQYLSLQGSGDAAAYLSIVWNAFNGGFLPSSVYGYANQLSFRFNPILILYAPLAKIFASPLLVILVHALIVFSSVAVLWRLGEAVGLPETPRWLLCLLLGSNPYFHNCLATWFFPETLPLPLFLAALIFWERKNYPPFALFAALLLTTKEETGVTLFAFGLAALCLPERRRAASAVMLCATAAFFAIAWSRHLFSRGLSDAEWTLFGWGNAGEGLGFIARHPLSLIRQWAWPPRRFLPLLTLLLYTGGLTVFFPPALLGLLLADAPHQWVPNISLGFHRLDNIYSSYLLPLLFWGTAHAVARQWKTPARRRPVAACLLICAAAGLWNSTDYVGFLRVSGERLSTGWEYVSLVRPEESLWSAQAFAPALAFRRRLKVFGGCGDAAVEARAFIPDVILARKIHLGADADLCADFMSRHSFRIVREERDLILWRRTGVP